MIWIWCQVQPTITMVNTKCHDGSTQGTREFQLGNKKLYMGWKMHTFLLHGITLSVEVIGESPNEWDRGANDKDGVTSVMMSNDYLFTSFGKLVKRGKN